MTLVVDATYRNRTSANGEDHLGKIFLELAAGLVATGMWRRIHQGDGLAAYSTGTSSIFTAHSGAGYAASGAWNQGVANSITNVLAYVVLEERVGGVATGRQLLLQRGSASGAGNDRLAVVSFAWEPFTGVPDSNTAPSAPTLSYTRGTINGAGLNYFVNLATSPQMGGGGGTIVHTLLVADAPCGTTEDVCPWWLVIYDSTADEPAFCLGYESLVDAAASDDHPCIFSNKITNASVWDFGEVIGTQPATHSSGGLVTFRGVSHVDGASVEGCIINQVTLPHGSHPASTEATPMPAAADGTRPIYPANIYLDTATLWSFKGTCEHLETLHPTADHLWPGTMFALVAHATELPRWSLGHVLIPWEVGLTPSGLSPTNSTDLRRVSPVAPTPDATAPTIGTFSPAAGAIAYTQDITIPISDNLGELRRYEVTAKFGDRWETVFDGEDLGEGYATSTELSGGNFIASRDDGWSGPVTVRAWAEDEDGNETTVETAYTISTSPNPAAPDSSLPTISNISPAPSSALVSDETAIEFDVLDDRGLAFYAVFARYLDKRDYDVVWDGAEFAPKYEGSTAEAISGGYHFAVVRDVENVGGWTTQGRVRFAVAAVDTAGNAEAA